MSNGQPLRTHSRFIPQEEIDDSTVVQWRFGAVNSHGSGVFAPAQPAAFIPAGSEQFNGFSPSLAHQRAPQPEVVDESSQEPEAPAFDEAQLQQMLEQARAEGHAQGLAEGRSQTQQQWQQRLDDHIKGAGRESVQRVDQVLQSLDENFKQMQSGMAQELLKLACDIARQVVRQELRTNPQALMPVVREALDMLGAESKPATVRLHPEDWKHLEAHVRAEWPNPKIEWLQDASVPTGGCRVESQGAQVDGGLEKRWQRAVGALGLVSTWYDGAAHG